MLITLIFNDSRYTKLILFILMTRFFSEKKERLTSSEYRNRGVSTKNFLVWFIELFMNVSKLRKVIYYSFKGTNNTGIFDFSSISAETLPTKAL